RRTALEKLEHVQELPGDAVRFPDRQRCPGDPLGEGLPLDVLRGHVEAQPHALSLAEAAHVRRNTGVVERAESLALALEGIELLDRGHGGELQLLERHPATTLIAG